MKRRIVTFLLTLFVVLGCLIPSTAQAAVPKNFTGISGSYMYLNGKKLSTKNAKAAGVDYTLITVSKEDSVTAASYKYFTYVYEGKTYAIATDGKLKTNMICGSKNATDEESTMYYYGPDGARVYDPVINSAVCFVRDHGGIKTKKATKLKNCFNYMANTANYDAVDDEDTSLFESAKLKDAALDLLQDNETGDSFTKASAFAYVARVLGYDAKVVGFVLTDGDGGVVPHAYTSVKDGKTWYVCDVAANDYKKTDKKYKYKGKISGSKEALALTLTNGVVEYTGTVEELKDVPAYRPEPEVREGLHLEAGVLYQGAEKYVGRLIEVPASRSVDNQPYKYFTVTVDGKNYAFDENARMYTNRIVGMGLYAHYFAEDGIRVDDEVIERAVKFVFNHGGSGNSVRDKLKACYKYLASRKNYSFASGMMTITNGTTKGLPGAAMNMLAKDNSGSGNCISWGSSFCYISRVLGYDVIMVKEWDNGYKTGDHGGHGLMYILDNDGKWKSCDPNQEYKSNHFMLSTYERWPNHVEYDMIVKNGSVHWKKADADEIRVNSETEKRIDIKYAYTEYATEEE